MTVTSRLSGSKRDELWSSASSCSEPWLPLRSHRRPVNEAPVVFYLIEQVFRHASMCEHQLRSAAGSGCERDGCHRIDALGEILSTPRLYQPASRHEVHVDAGDLPGISRKFAAGLAAHDSFAAGDFRAPARVGQQFVDRRGWGFEANFVFDGFTHRGPPFSSAYPTAT